jgi:DNA-cytosine methyltransferase
MPNLITPPETKLTQVVSTDTNPLFTNERPIICGSICSGIGAFEQAMKNINIPHINEFAVEINKFSRKTFLANHSVNNMYEDITKLNPKDLNYVDIALVSCPCQAFSLMGKRGGLEDTRGTLTFDALNVINEKQPRVVIFENVPGMLNHDEGNTFKIILAAFEELNYTVKHSILNASDFSSCQERKRLFLVCIRDDIDFNFEFPKPDLITKKTINDYIKVADFSKHIFDASNRYDAPNINYSPIKKLYRLSDVSYNKDSVIISSDASHPTILTTKGRKIWDTKNKIFRYLSLDELSSIVGFPEKFIYPVSDAQKTIEIGNSISIPLLEALIKQLFVTSPKTPKVVNKIPAASITNTSTHTYTAKKTNISKSSKPDCISLLQTIKLKEGYVSGPIITQGIKAIRKTATDRTTEVIKAHINKPLLSKNMYINQALINYSKDQDIFENIEAMNSEELTTYLKDRDSGILNFDSFADNSNTKKLVLFPYAGGKQGVNKSKMQSLVSNAFKTKKYTRFIDSFAGGLGATYNVLPIILKNNIEEIVVNDINKSIINLYRQIQKNPKQVQRQLASISLDYFKEFGKFAPETREEARALHIKLEAEFKQLELDKKMNPRRTSLFMYLIHQSTGAMTDWNIEAKISKFEKSYKIINLDLLINKVALYNKILNSTKFKLKSVKYQTLFNTYKTDTNALMLIDPPYIEYQEKIETTEGCSFTYGINFDQKELLTKVKSLKCDLIYYNNHNPLIENFAIKNGFNYSKNSRTFANNSEDRTKSVEICMTKLTPANTAISHTTANCNINTRQVA